jgi:Protein of unknown function (DUF3293)
MDKALIDAFRATDYLVCLDEVTWASIHVDQPLPAPLQALVGTRSWGFITAWNPRSQECSPEDNLVAQRELLAALRAWQDAVVYPAVGVGASGWCEPSLFVIGPDLSTLDALGQRYRQNAYVHGHGLEVARLRLLRP